MSDFSITGIVHKLSASEQKGAKGFTVRELVLEISSGNFTEYVAFQLTQAKCDLPESLGIKEGDTVTVHFDLRGREWQGRFFTNLNAWKLEKLAAGAALGALTPATPEPAPATTTAAAAPAEADEDLPF